MPRIELFQETVRFVANAGHTGTTLPIFSNRSSIDEQDKNKVPFLARKDEEELQTYQIE